MPLKTGIWSYFTECNMKSLNKKTGWFECIKAIDCNHGMVKVCDT
jgi:hypothetical protein